MKIREENLDLGARREERERRTLAASLRGRDGE
jgi:hypothetical protein